MVVLVYYYFQLLSEISPLLSQISFPLSHWTKSFPLSEISLASPLWSFWSSVKVTSFPRTNDCFLYRYNNSSAGVLKKERQISMINSFLVIGAGALNKLAAFSFNSWGKSLIVKLIPTPITVSYTHLTLPTNREV